MDHLTIPAGSTHIRVPYRCTEPYDGGDFFDYPSRKGWTKDQLLGKDNFGARSSAEIESFFQTWLYFGTLITVFKLQEIELDQSEFLETDESSGEVFVTTVQLLNKVCEWRPRYKASGSEGTKQTQKILTELSGYIDRYCGVEGREHQGIMRASVTSAAWPVSGEISMSMIALGYLLSEAGEILEAGHTNMRWGASPWLKAKLLESGWCPLDVRRLLADVAIDGHYYLALTECPYDKERHRGCNEFGCHACTIVEETYVTRHVEPKCRCEFDTATKEVVGVIQADGIPVVSWKKNGDKGSRLVVDDGKWGETVYVAISHVWADGLGNPFENSLSICQLERVQACVDALFPPEDHPVRFWMDTLCIPVAEEYKPLRKKSIQMMRQIYRRAGAVLVFDSSLQQLSLASTNNEKAMGIYMSNWLHRLWTFQEGMLAKKLYFQLKDGPLYEQTFCDASVEEQKVDQERGLFGSFQFTARCAALGHFTILRDFVDMKLAGNGVYFPPLSHAVQQRTTTRISDEGICAAAILDMDMKDIMAVETTNVPDEVVAAKRMEIFLKQVGEFPPGIIFHHQQRLKTEGYRWAPKTLLGARPADFARDIEGEHSSFRGKGLRVRYPGFTLESLPPGQGSEILVVMKHSEHRFRLQLFPDKGDEPLSPNATYGVIMFRSLSARQTMGTDAILGVLKDPAEVDEKHGRHKRRTGTVLDKTINLRCECRAWLEPFGIGLRKDTVGAELFGERQKWRVF